MEIAIIARFHARGAERFPAFPADVRFFLCYTPPVAVHVSIHDVSPAWASEIDLALEYTRAVGVRPALLVVPNFHGGWSLDDHPDFCERLRTWQAQGHEIYLHGFFHKSKETTRRDLAWLYAQKIVSGGEAEFRDLSQPEAEARLSEGEDMLRRAGLTIDGFIAPAWAMHGWLLPMLGKRGYAFTEDHLHVYDPAANKKRTSVVLNYASRTPGRLVSSVAWCRLAKYAKIAFPARIAIHPADMRFAWLRYETRRLLDWAKGDTVDTGRALFH